MSGLQGRDSYGGSNGNGGGNVSSRFLAARLTGASLLALPDANVTRLLRDELLLPDDVSAALLPWIARLRSPNPKVWAFGVHCCARWLANMPTREQWHSALALDVYGPLRPKDASVHRIGWSGRRFLETFKSFHQVLARGT